MAGKPPHQQPPQAGTSAHPRTGVYPSPSPTTHTRKPAARAAAASATARASNNQAGWRDRCAEACGYTAARAAQSRAANWGQSVSSISASAPLAA